MRFPIVAIVCAATLTSSVLSSSLAAQSRYEGPNGPVEVLGLRTWTLPMLRDSIRHYVPGQDLHDAACQVTLREKLGFADALVNSYLGYTSDGKEFLVIKLIEPQSAKRVVWNREPDRAGQSLLPSYGDLIQPVTDTAGAVHVGRIVYWLQLPFELRAQFAAKQPSDPRRGDPAVDAERVTAFQRARSSEADRRRALSVLSTNGFWANRLAAVTVLANFPQHDSTWLALVHAMRDPNESVRSAAQSVMQAMPKRAVDWRPAVDDLRLLLGGTNVSGIGRLFEVLTETQVSPDLAAPLLRDNADWVLDHVAASAPMVSGGAKALLRQLNRGVIAGPTRADWEPWVRGLSSKGQ